MANNNPTQGGGPDASVNQLPDPSTFAAPDGRKKKGRRHVPEKKADLSINSLLDILSVILVFLMKSYSTSTVQVKPSKDLQVPMSYSSQFPKESTAITITLKNIMIDDVPVMTLEDGKAAAQDKAGGGYMLEPLFQKLQEAVDHEKRIAAMRSDRKFEGLCTIIADRNVPFHLLTEVMYTAGQAQFGKYNFAIVKAERT